ncbi:MAG: carboxyltransferase domain-containing protein [Actinomycetota bacterium]
MSAPQARDDMRVRPVGDAAILVEYPTSDPSEAWLRVRALDRALAAVDLVVESCPALVNLLVRFDPRVTDHDAVADAVAGARPGELDTALAIEHTIEIRYDRSPDGDLAAVAAAVELSVDEVSERHLAASYEVRMYGFAPGYAYLGGVPESIRRPRKPTPVRDVPAGSVLIANDQCLITTVTMPTGWWVIGSSPTPILDPDAARPAPFDVGDRVRFVSADHPIADR